MVRSISLRWKVFGVNFRACSRPPVIQPIVSKPLDHEEVHRRKGREKVEKGRLRFQERLRFFGRGARGVGAVERKALSSLLLQAVPVPKSYLTLALGSLWLPAGDPLTPGAGSERREEDSFDSDSTATLLK